MVAINGDIVAKGAQFSLEDVVCMDTRRTRRRTRTGSDWGSLQVQGPSCQEAAQSAKDEAVSNTEQLVGFLSAELRRLLGDRLMKT